MSKYNSTVIRHCTDCEVTFQVYTKRALLKFYCPVCGDNITVVAHKAHRNGLSIKGKGTKPGWSDEELELLNGIIAGKLTNYSVAIQLGRSTNAVCKRVGRLREEQHKNIQK